jgi:hypothetical protein
MGLHVNEFSGGVAVLGSADTRAVNEILLGDSLDIGPRGALQCASDVTDYVAITTGVPNPWSKLYALLDVATAGYTKVLAIGEGDVGGGTTYLGVTFSREGTSSPVVSSDTIFFGIGVAPKPQGVWVTSVVFAGVFQMAVSVGVPTNINVFLVNIGAREGTYPTDLGGAIPGLSFVLLDSSGVVTATFNIAVMDTLGTGAYGELSIAGVGHGTKAKGLFFRGILAYNNFVMGWGFDSADTTNGDGPCRVMFSNIGNPLKWGNDNIAPPPPETDRFFTDSDAITLGGAGEIIRAGLVIFGKAFFATNRSLHFVQGFGRDSFITNGAIPVMNAYNCVGPHALIEGPDRLMYGVSDQGLWQYDGYNVPVPLFQKLVDFAGHSAGYWDQLWTDPSASASDYPGRTNQDLIWMACDYTRQQVLVGIPFCSIANGTGAGTDTVVIKYHIRGGGFTRQQFPGVTYTAAGYFRRQGQQNETRMWGTATSGQDTVQRYAFQETLEDDPVLPTILPDAIFGYYSPFGPDGQGVVRRGYVTIAWEDATASLPIVFTVLFTVDQAVVSQYTLSVQRLEPTNPSEGDCWLDTSQSNPSIGNARAGQNVPATGGYLYNTFTGGRWLVISGQGTKGNRATIPLTLIRREGTRVTVGLACTSAAGRFEIEGLGMDPGAGVADA